MDGEDTAINQVSVSLVTNYDGTGIVSIYKWSATAANLAGTGTITKDWVATDITLTKFTAIDAWSTNEYVVAVDNLTMPSWTPNWTIKVTNVRWVHDSANYDVNRYTNLGALPFVESK